MTGVVTKVALTIAGSDSGSGAGVQADLKTFAAHGVYGTCALTAVTAQNTRAVTDVEILKPKFVQSQIDAVVSDIGVDAVKTGMLATESIIVAVTERLTGYGIEKIVVDPVMFAKSGDALLDPSSVSALCKLLVPIAFVVTPNLPEAEALTGISIEGEEGIKDAARRIVDLGARAVVVKGGHDCGSDSTDWLYDGQQFSRFSTNRIESDNTHGTGCTFAAAITARLARGDDLFSAIDTAKKYLTTALERGIPIGKGYGPVDHFLGVNVWGKEK